MRFKVGDKIICTDGGLFLEKEQTYTVKYVGKDEDRYFVLLEETVGRHFTEHFRYHKASFELSEIYHDLQPRR